MKIIVQMDPIERLNLAGDSTFALLLEAQERGYDIDIYTPNMLTLNDGLLSAEAQQIKAYHSPDRIEELNHPRSVLLGEYDIVLMRQDPPFDMSYITATHLLETIQDKTLILNNPFMYETVPEKIFVNKYMKYMPHTLITRNIIIVKFQLLDFVKPLMRRGVFYSEV